MTYNAFLLGKVVPSHKGIYIASNGLEIHLPNYEVFVTHGPGQWIRTSKSSIPPSAILAGKRLVENLFVGRVLHNGTLTPGRVHPPSECCVISYDGREYYFENYEILIS